jgi:hypothetical protein
LQTPKRAHSRPPVPFWLWHAKYDKDSLNRNPGDRGGATDATLSSFALNLGVIEEDSYALTDLCALLAFQNTFGELLPDKCNIGELVNALHHPEGHSRTGEHLLACVASRGCSLVNGLNRKPKRDESLDRYLARMHHNTSTQVNLPLVPPRASKNNMLCAFAESITTY